MANIRVGIMVLTKLELIWKRTNLILNNQTIKEMASETPHNQKNDLRK